MRSAISLPALIFGEPFSLPSRLPARRQIAFRMILMGDLQSIHAYIFDFINDMAAERVRSFGDFAENFVRALPRSMIHPAVLGPAKRCPGAAGYERNTAGAK